MNGYQINDIRSKRAELAVGGLASPRMRVQEEHRSVRKLSNRNRSNRSRGFTLIELLIVITIIAILAALTAVVLTDAANDARIARTKTQIERLHLLIMNQWEKYETRQLQLQIPEQASLANVTQARLWAMRELMRAELPDRLTDIVVDPTAAPSAMRFQPMRVTLNTGNPNFGRQPFPSLQRTYARAVANARSQYPSADLAATYESAECLYMIINSIENEFGGGLENFKNTEIGDVDEDGLNELLDSWGNPIEFVRWPAGFRSPLQPVVAEDFYIANYQSSGTEPSGYTKEPFDPFGADIRVPNADPRNYYFRPYLITPLIFSSGTNQAPGLYRFDAGAADTTWASSLGISNPARQAVLGTATSPPTGPYPFNDPFVYSGGTLPSGANIQIASPFATGEQIDNIDNHNGTMVP